MRRFDVTGMSCAACQSRVERAVSAVPGVTSCAVSLLTNEMGVEGTAEDAAIIRAVTDAGYGASVRGTAGSGAAGSGAAGSGADPKAADAAEALKDRESPRLLRKLLLSLGFLLVLMYISMGHGMLGWPLPAFLAEDCVANGLTQLLLAATVMLIHSRFFTSGSRSLLHGAPNMDTLVALGSGASFCYSVYVLYRMSAAVAAEGAMAGHVWLHQLYFESAAMILTLITVGKLLEAKSKGRTTDALRSLMRLAPRTATLLRDGQETEVPVSEVRPGDPFVVRTGGSVPVDGTILSGSAAVDQSALTGESVPADLAEGDTVSAATTVTSGYIVCRATRVGEDTTLAQIIRMVSDTAATKAPIAKTADRVSAVFVPAVMGLALLTAIVWLLLGRGFGQALIRGVSVLVISCPCALGLATPVAIMVGSGMGAKHGILFKTAASLEETGRVAVMALDKTGTITRGEPVVTDLVPAPGVSEAELLEKAAALEAPSEHPLAKAVTRLARERGVTPRAVEGFRSLPGSGVEAVLDGAPLSGGSARAMAERLASEPGWREKADALAERGRTPLCFTEGERLLGMIAVADTIKEDSAEAIRQLRGLGIRTVMITGDNARTATAIAKEAGVDEVIADVLPQGKARAVRSLRRYGRVAMVGDGINDAPALTEADIGIAIGAGTDIAIDAADVVLMDSRLTSAAMAVRLSRATLRTIRQDLFWAFFYNVLCIPLAAGAYASLGLELDPMIGAACMSLSSFCVVMNALRLNLRDLRSPRHDRPLKTRAP